MYCIRGFVKERAPRLAAASAAALAGAYLLLVNHFILWPSEPIRSVLLDSAAHENSAPLGVIFQSAVALSVRADNDVIRAHRGGFSFGASKPPSSGDEVYVWVIGESSRPKNWSLFGYARNTSPRLGAIPGIITFPDMLTTAPETLIAVPSMLSLRPITDWPGVQAQRSVVSAFNEAGFRTYWLSTQDLDAWAGIVPQIAAEAGTTRYFSQGYDGSMLGEFRRILDSEPPGNRKLFIVLHTKGSHFNYVHRYPREFAKFDTANPTRRDRIVDTYDNSVLYTDWFLSELISLLSARHTLAALLYASDHGENLLDDDRHLLGHTIGSKYDLSTASFLWLSDELWQRNPDLVANAERHASLPLSLSDLPHSMLHLAGIEAPQRDIRMSVFSASFEPHVRFYLLGGKVLVDQPSSAAKR
jgi:glucan phosphoethanolaminetransferase (alkaline phosphatase superfamily)